MNEDPLECPSTAGRRSWRLAVDPFLTKGARKLYKYDDEPLPECALRHEDPRTRKAAKLDLPLNLPVPKLKVDENSRLSRELGIINLKETVTPEELKRACSGYGTVVKTRVLYHPTTKAPLLLGRVVFESLKSAQNFYGRYQNAQFLGKTIRLFWDYNGTKLHQLYKETIEKNKKSCPADERNQSVVSGGKPGDEVDPRIYRLNTGVPMDTAPTEAVGQTAARSYPSCVAVVAPSVQPPGEPRFQYPQYSTQQPPCSLASPTLSNAPRPGIPAATVPLVPAVAPPPVWHHSGSPSTPWQQQQAQFWQAAPPPSIRPPIAPPTVPPPPGAPAQPSMPAIVSVANLQCPRTVAPGGTARPPPPPPFLPFQRPPLTAVPYPPTPSVGANVAAIGANAKIANYNPVGSIESMVPAAVGAMMGNNFGPSFLNGLAQSNATPPTTVSQLPGWNGGDLSALALRWKAATEFANAAGIPGGLNGQVEPVVKEEPTSSRTSEALQQGTVGFATGTALNGPEPASTPRRRSDSSRHDLESDVKRIKLSSSDSSSANENHAARRRCRHKSCCPKYKASRQSANSEEQEEVSMEMSEKEVEKIPLPQQSSIKIEVASNSEAEMAAEQAPRSSLSPFSSEDERESLPKAEAESRRPSDPTVPVKHPVTPSNSDNEELDDGLEVKCYAKMGAIYTPEESDRSADSDSSISSRSASDRSGSSRRRRYSPLNAVDERFSGDSSQGTESMCISPANSNSSGNAEILQRKDSEAAATSTTSLNKSPWSTGQGNRSPFCGVTATASATASFSCNSGPSSSTSFRDAKEGDAQSWGRSRFNSSSSPTSKRSVDENLGSPKVKVWLDAIINRCYTDISEELSEAIRRDLVRLFLDFALRNFTTWKTSIPRKEAPTQPDASPKHNSSSPHDASEHVKVRTNAVADDVLDNIRVHLPKLPSFRRKAVPRTPSSSPEPSDDDEERKSSSSLESEIVTRVASKHGTPLCSDFEDEERWSPTSDTFASTRSSDISRTEDSSNASTSIEAKVTDGGVRRATAEPKKRALTKNALQSKSPAERRGRKRGRKGAANAKKPRRARKASNVLFINLDEEDFHTGSDTAIERSEDYRRSPPKPASVCWDGCMVIEGKYSPRQHDHGYSLGGSTMDQSLSSWDSSVNTSLDMCESAFAYASKERQRGAKAAAECSFGLRSAKEEAAIIHSLNSASLSREDLAYLKSASALMLSSIAEIPLLTLHWSRPTEQTLLRSIALRHEEPPIQIAHKSGGARTEGFYRLSKKEKNLQAVRVLQKFASEGADPDAVVKAPQAQELRAQTRAMQRLLFTNYGTETDSEWLKYDQMQSRKKLVRFDVSKIHGWGLFAMEDITPDEMIIEYVGQKIRMTVAERREEVYEKRGIGSSYLFRIDNEWVIDATKHGNLARFINHSCAPNCYAKVISVNSQKRIVIYSKQNIKRGEEITYDYKFPREDEKIPCNCRSFNCRGSLN